MISMAHQINQHTEGRLPFNADWEQASLMGSLPAGLVHCLLRLAAMHSKKKHLNLACYLLMYELNAQKVNLGLANMLGATCSFVKQ